MKNLITKGYVAAQVNLQAFMKDNRGTVIEYVLIIALGAVFVGLINTEFTTIVNNAVTNIKATLGIKSA